MLLERSGEERLKMGCSMHALSQGLVKAGVLQRNPNASSATLRQSLFIHFYGNEFEPRRRKRILLALRKAAEDDGKRRQKVKEEARKIVRS